MKTGFKVFMLLIIISLSACRVADVPEIQPGATPANNADYQNITEPRIEIPVFVRPDKLPDLYITGIAAHEVSHREWTRGVSISLQGAGEDFDFENMSARIRGRGNATWWAMGEKRPYRIKFEAPRSMFGTEYIARDWVLLANSIDYSLMRNVGAFELGARMGRFDFSPLASQFVHLYVDGDYRGVYQFTDQIKQGQGRADVQPHHEPALCEYFIHWCRHGRRPEDIPFWADDIPFEVRYPNPDDITPEHVEFIAAFTTKVSLAIRGGDFGEVSGLIDIPTFVDFYLVNEFTKNADVFFSSVFFTVRLEDGGHKMYAGPIWDFDQSAGGTSDSFYPDYSPQGIWAAESNEWLRRLMRIPEFRKLVSERWFEIRDVEIAETLAEIRYLTAFYYDDFLRNFDRWTDKLGHYLWRTPREMQAIDNYAGQVDYLLDWYEQRIVWMDEYLS